MPSLPERSGERIADCIEAKALARSRPLPAQDIERLAKANEWSSTDVSLAMRVVTQRKSLLHENYPFRTASGSIAAESTAPASYWTAMLLLGADSPVREDRQLWSEAADVFERLVALAQDNFFGGGTRVLRFAHPSDEGRPAEFAAAVKWLAEKMQISLGAAYRDPVRKDGGVDVVAWRPFPDRRSGFPVLLTQCTVERDFAYKADDIDLRIWSGWLALEQDPLTALAVPHVVPSGEVWNLSSLRTMLLDRSRIMSLLSFSALTDERNRGLVDDWLARAVAFVREVADE